MASRKLPSDGSSETYQQPSGRCSFMQFSVDAAPFVPSWLASSSTPAPAASAANDKPPKATYAATASSGCVNTNSDLLKKTVKEAKEEEAEVLLCPYHETGTCIRGDKCPFVHGEMCELCQKAVLIPNDPGQHRAHRAECVEAHEKAMEIAFATQNSVDKVCGICLENVWQSSGRFGILPNCRHCFCLECIRKWRKSTELQSETIRSCPECRTLSHFIIPAVTWVEDGPEKQRLIDDYMNNTSGIRCKYFTPDNRDSCKFGNQCFYRHENDYGELVHSDSPGEIARRTRSNVIRSVEYYIDDSILYSDDDDQHEAEILATIIENMNSYHLSF